MFPLLAFVRLSVCLSPDCRDDHLTDPLALPMSELDIKRTVIYRAQTLNSHMRDLLFSNNNQTLKAFF
jgi:hypothetical protein